MPQKNPKFFLNLLLATLLMLCGFATSVCGDGIESGRDLLLESFQQKLAVNDTVEDTKSTQQRDALADRFQEKLSPSEEVIVTAPEGTAETEVFTPTEEVATEIVLTLPEEIVDEKEEIGAAASELSEVTLPSTSSLSTDGDDEMVYLLDDFVVSAEDDQGYYSANTLAGTRTNELTKNIPMTISTVNQEMIQDFGLQTLADLGNYVPSIESEGNSWSNSEIRFRGFLSRNQLYEFLPRYSQVDYYNIERADIIRGANSLIYGQADPGGKVNLISKTANLSKDENRYTQEFGSFGSFKYNLDVNRVIGDNAAIRIMAVDRSKGYEQEDKYFNFTGVTVEALANVGDKTRLRLHLENTKTKRSREVSAFKDNSGQAGFTGMPKNIVADPKLADLMSDAFVNYLVDYNDPESGEFLRSRSPRHIGADDIYGRDGFLVKDYFSGDTMEEKRQSIRDFYTGIDYTNSGYIPGKDAYSLGTSDYIIGEITHQFSDNLQLKTALAAEFSDTYARTRSSANTLHFSLNGVASISVPNLVGDTTYEDLFINAELDAAYREAGGPNSNNDYRNAGRMSGEIGLYANLDVENGLRSATLEDFKNYFFDSGNQAAGAISRWTVEDLTAVPGFDYDNDGLVSKANNPNLSWAQKNGERDAKREQLASQIATALEPFLAGGIQASASNLEFQQAIEQAISDYSQMVDHDDDPLTNDVTKGFTAGALDSLYSNATSTESVSDDGETRAAIDTNANEVLKLYAKPYWQEQESVDDNKSIRNTFSWDIEDSFIPGRQQVLIGLDYDLRNASQIRYQEFQFGSEPGPTGVVLGSDRAADFIYIDDYIAGIAGEALDFNNTQSGFPYEGGTNNPNSSLVRDNKLMPSSDQRTVMLKTYEADTQVDTLGTWIAASGSYQNGRLRTLFGARVDTITVDTELVEYVVNGQDNALKEDDPYRNNDKLKFKQFSPSIGALYWLTPELGVFGNYAESVISPTGYQYDVFGDITPPETGEGFEVGLKYSSTDGKINAQLTAFLIEKMNEQNTGLTYSQLSTIFPRTSSGDIGDNANVIAENETLWIPQVNDETGLIDRYQFNPIGARVADEKTQSEGIELDLYYNPTSSLSLFLGYAYLETIKLESSLDALVGLTVPGTSNHSANVTVRYAFQSEKLKGCFVGANQKYRSAALLNTFFLDADNNGEQDFTADAPRFELYLEEQFTTDVFVGWSGPLGKGRGAPRARVQLTARNIFDEINLISTGVENARYTDTRRIDLTGTLTF